MMENTHDAIRKLLILEPINEFDKLQDVKLIHRNFLHSCAQTMKDQKEIKETVPFTITTDRINYLGINASKEAKEPVLRTL